MARGLTPLHHGFWLENVIFPPSEFAMAWAGNHKPNVLEVIIDSTISDLEAGQFDDSEVEFLIQYNEEIKEQFNRPFSIGDLETLAEMRFGTRKFIKEVAVQEINDSKNLGTVSFKETVSGEITSRRKGQIQRNHSVTLYSPFIEYPEDIYDFWVDGGTKHGAKTMAKGCHWSKGLKHEKGFLRALKLSVQRQFRKGETHLQDKDVSQDYTGPVFVMDYARSAMVDMLQRLVHSRSNLVKGQDLDLSVLIPYDFSIAPQLGLEGVLRVLHHPGKNGIAMKNTPQQTLAQVDKSYIGKTGFITPLFKFLFKERRIFRGTLPNNKSINDYSWAVLQAFEAHNYQKKRRFSKFSLEFPGTPYETVSVVMEEPGSDRSIRLLYSDHFKRPYYLVKYTKSEEVVNMYPGLEVDPLAMVNIADDVHKRPVSEIKQWSEIDYRSGKPVLCRLHEPNKEILNLAWKLSQKPGFIGVLPITMMNSYEEIYQQVMKDKVQF